MKLIFLDIDGVLNTPRSREETGGEEPTYLSWVEDCVEQLKRIIDHTKAEIVIASSWRFPKKVHALHRAFMHFKLQMWIDMIPYLKKHPKDSRRGKEIKQFLKGFNEDVESYVILDDKSGSRLTKEQEDNHLIKVDENEGLSEKDANKAIEILNWDDDES